MVTVFPIIRVGRGRAMLALSSLEGGLGGRGRLEEKMVSGRIQTPCEPKTSVTCMGLSRLELNDESGRFLVLECAACGDVDRRVLGACGGLSPV